MQELEFILLLMKKKLADREIKHALFLLTNSNSLIFGMHLHIKKISVENDLEQKTKILKLSFLIPKLLYSITALIDTSINYRYRISCISR